MLEDIEHRFISEGMFDFYSCHGHYTSFGLTVCIRIRLKLGTFQFVIIYVFLHRLSVMHHNQISDFTIQRQKFAKILI